MNCAETTSPISVVVIGRNEGDRLVRCLESVLRADYPRDQIDLIYVDSGSTDGSCARAEAMGARAIAVRPERPCAAIGRNAGFRAANHEFVQFLDGDTVLDPSWLRMALTHLSGPDVACVFGRRDEIAPHETIYNLWTHHDWHTAPGDADTCPGDAMFRRSVLEKMDGYDEGLIAGEEPDLCFRILRQTGMRILSLDAPMTRHDVHMTRFRSYWRRCFRTGHAYAEVSARHPWHARWRRTLRRNLLHSVALVLSVALTAAMRSWTPLGLWIALELCLIARSTLRLRLRTGSIRDALLYSIHLYASKLPMALGQLDYRVRRTAGRRRGLIEYREGPILPQRDVGCVSRLGIAD